MTWHCPPDDFVGSTAYLNALEMPGNYAAEHLNDGRGRVYTQRREESIQAIIDHRSDVEG